MGGFDDWEIPEYCLPILDAFEDPLEDKFAIYELDGGEASLFPEYKWNPVGFTVDILGVDLWLCQREIAELLRDHPRVSVAACYASGKTFLAACLVLWWLFTRVACLVVTTAPTGRQVKELLWNEIKLLHARSRVRLGGKILSRETRIDASRRGYGVAGDGKSTNAGYHTDSGCVLFIVDEKAGMKREVLADFDGLMVDEDECRELGIGNPVSTEGPFFDEHNSEKEMARWVQYSISALKTPNLTGSGDDKKKYPGLVSRSWVEDKRRKWGEKHPLWVTKVEGRFWVVEGAQKVVPKEWADLAADRWAEYFDDDGTDVLGCDVAGSGQNLNMVYRQKGRRVFKVDSWSAKDLLGDTEEKDKAKIVMKTALRIVTLAETLKVKVVNIDAQGLGIGIAGRVLELKDEGRLKGIEVNSVEMGAGAHESKHFCRIVDEVQFAMRDAFDPENPKCVAIDPTDTELRDQLPMRSWWIVGEGEDSSKIKVTRKRDLDESPDNADAVSLLFYKPKVAEGDYFFI